MESRHPGERSSLALAENRSVQRAVLWFGLPKRDRSINFIHHHLIVTKRPCPDSAMSGDSIAFEK